MRTLATILTLIASLTLTACKKPSTTTDTPETTGHIPITPPPPFTASIKVFWLWFSNNAVKLRSEKDLASVMEKISKELAMIDKSVFAEIGEDKNERLLVLSANGRKELFPLVEQIYAARPTNLVGWKIVAFRQRRDPASLQEMKFEMDGKKYDASMVQFTATRTGDKLDVVLYWPSEDVNDQTKNMLMILLDHTIGEYDTETKIGAIDFGPKSKAPKTAQPLSALAAVVDQNFPPKK